jgi:hypothetical protein
VSLFRGGAGTGKSFTLREVQNELQSRHCIVLVVAPQRQQVLGLETDGLKNVETVSAFLARRQMPRNAVVLVDEAGQIGGKQMHALFRLAHRGNTDQCTAPCGKPSECDAHRLPGFKPRGSPTTE